MERHGNIVHLKPEAYEQYKKLHAEVWPSVLKTITECNIRNYSIFYKDGQLFSYFEYIGDDFQQDMKKMAADPETQKWWDVCGPLLKDGDWWVRMEEVFHTD